MPGKRKPSRTASLNYEQQVLAQGFRHIVGMDEAGRGAWAGPVAAGAVCLPIEDPRLSEILEGVRDSKELTPHRRAVLVETIKTTAIAWGTGSASVMEIDNVGIASASRLAMRRALEALLRQKPDLEPDYLFTDYVKWHTPPLNCPMLNLKKGDQLSLSIAAASILGKTFRDEEMHRLDTLYPGYAFARHKGYGTAFHLAQLQTIGASDAHRATFAPIRNLAGKNLS
jgi:ribonuclease HII